MWHLIFAGFVIAPTRHLVARFTPGKGAQMLAGALTGTAASLLLGYISYHAYEVHFLRAQALLRLPWADEARRTIAGTQTRIWQVAFIRS